MPNMKIAQLIVNGDLLLCSTPSGMPGAFAEKATANKDSVAFITHQGLDRKSAGNTFVLSDKRMAESNQYLARANKSVHRSWPTQDAKANDGIRASSYLVRWCQRVYAVGLFTDDASLLKIAGELAWPCQMYVDRFLYDQEPMDLCELYFYDLKGETWFGWRHRWHRTNSIAKPSGIYAAIGNDRMTKAAKKAIDDLWRDDSAYDNT